MKAESTWDAKPAECSSQEMLPIVYEELRRLAATQLRHESAGQTLQATALVHEAYLRLTRGTQSWHSKGHFFSAAAKAMRRILIENARRKKSLRGGRGAQRVEVAESAIGMTADHERLVELDDALTQLTKLDARAAEIAELRLFAGMTLQELAEAFGISQSAAFREWSLARAWLKSQLGDE